MKCPIDGNDLLMTERQGIEIDYCPKCRGVWLDRGELDKIIDRTGAEDAQAFTPAQHRHEAPYQRRSPGHGDKPYKKKRKSLLGELFDF